jgi:zinc protease
MVPTKGRFIKLKGQSRNVQFAFAYQGGREGTKDAYIRDILGVVLGQGESSYLMQKYVSGSSPLLTRMMAYNYGMHQGGIFLVAGEVLTNKKYDDFFKKFAQDSKHMCTRAIDERSVSKAKNRYFIDYFNALETNSGIASMLGAQEIIFGNYLHYKQEVANYDAITPKDVMEMCVNVFDKDKGDIFAIWEKF